MNYTVADVKKLREETGATFADCKTALTESKSWEEAVKYLEARSSRKAEKVTGAGRETSEGGVFAYVHHNNSVGVLLELNCSTDFVARSETFRNLANELTLQIAGVAPKYITVDDVPAEVIEAKKQEILQDPSMERVPEAKRETVVTGKLNKALATEVLMLQPWVKDEAVTIGDLVRKAIADTGENIVVRRFSRFKLGE
ncbi:elongation factor Ts [Thermosporothrix hazakensis]|jgi:elongation factor Ts|uniref:Elongation factor Ts n=1 Tax=Thermosporothrix hazakensis TaxID=644383 RepID=A0A326UC33_THEHA|nr:elongation factor Ts [Thermosporothrix hazakensis]PZW36182.1 elongation factor Ts [Thermosporothrix hazakensis]GCE46833.1 elongation factor Ts [Thermosporothrix hazakensis]